MTTNISFSYSDTLEKIHLRIEYYAGKRAADGEEFFKLKACNLDNSLIREFIDIAVTSIRLALGRRCVGFTLSADNLIFTVDTLSDDLVDTEEALAVTFRNYIVESVTAKWLALAGVSSEETGFDSVQALLELAPVSLRSSKASPRRFPPI